MYYYFGNILSGKYCIHYVIKSCSRFQHTSSLLCPLTKYDLKISEGKLISDDHQRNVVSRLQRVYDDVQDYKPPRRSMFLKFLSMKSSVTAPRGIYLYGAVGGGKTMLMDLFYSCCKVRLSLLFEIVLNI